MSPFVALALVALVMAVFPAIMITANLREYRRPAGRGRRIELPRASVLIPARNEADKIERTLAAVRASRGVDFEILVMDDSSEDQTAQIVKAISAEDPRVQLLTAPELPADWCGKQHACWNLAQAADSERLVFLDADVTLAPDALASMLAQLEVTDVELLSGFPRQITGTFLERLLIPLIHFVLLGFLPIARMRQSRQPAYAAGCGQLMVARRRAYFEAGGHRAIRASRHDGIQLPRAFRRAGLMTDLFDATGVATCRMYRSAGEVWNGLAKNATEGMAAPAAIVPWTLVLSIGQVLPALLFVGGLFGQVPATAAVLGGAAFAVSLLSRFALGHRFEQSLLGAWLHPIGVLTLVLIQWHSLAGKLAGRSVAWKGRTEEAAPDAVHSS